MLPGFLLAEKIPDETELGMPLEVFKQIGNFTDAEIHDWILKGKLLVIPNLFTNKLHILRYQVMINLTDLDMMQSKLRLEGLTIEVARERFRQEYSALIRKAMQ